MDKEYFVFRTDGDGKQYLIPEKDADLFKALLEEAFDTNDYRIFSERFNNFKIGYLFHYKFQNPVLMTEQRG